MRKTLTELGFAEVWAVPMLEQAFDFNKGAGEHFQRVIDALAAESGYRELSAAPVVTLGHSASATWPWNFAAWNPGRTICVLSVHGDAPQTHLTGYGRPNVDWGDRNIDGVPGLMVMSENEWWEDRLTPLLSFQTKHPSAPVALLADAGRGHFDYSDELVSFLAMFVRKAAAARLPAELPASLEQPLVLRSVDPKSGWRIDRWRKDQLPSAQAAPYDRYTGDPTQSFWCFDEEMARAAESYYATARGKRPQLVGFVDAGGKVYAGEPCEPPFEPFDDGISFHLKARFLETVSGTGGGPARWAGLPTGTALGHAAGGGPVTISRIVGPVAQTGPDTFALRFDRAQYPRDGRKHDMWMLASHPGDERYKSAVQQAVVRARPNTAGTSQTITFPPVGNQSTAVKTVKLAAHSGAGLPVRYYIREGPAEVTEGGELRFTTVPPRAKLPVTVTVVAWQWGRSTEPKVQTAAPVEMTFSLVRP
jgi:hypothetical protein